MNTTHHHEDGRDAVERCPAHGHDIGLWRDIAQALAGSGANLTGRGFRCAAVEIE
ncbi:MAG TPA: hypothetical protein VGF65_03935 [Mycobacterium sp.]|jgi:hypothetical protein